MSDAGKVKKQRASNIELLRILIMLGVVILHYNHADIGGGFQLVKHDSINYYLMYVLESASIVAVNLFVLISGYFMVNNQRRDIFKPLTLLLQVVVFKETLYLVRLVVEGGHPELQKLLMNLVPKNYFVILYVALYLISPYLNLLLHSLDEKGQKRLLVILLLLFSVEPTCVDLLNEFLGSEQMGLSMIGLYGSEWGYSIINFALLYLIGAYLKLHEVPLDRVPLWKLLGGYLLFMGIDTVWSLANEHMVRYEARSAYSYCNPLVICGAVLLFALFRKIRIKNNVVINLFAKASFTVYLVHSALLPFCKISEFVNRSPLIYLAHVLLTIISIYLISWVMFVVYDFASKYFFAFLQSKIRFYHYEVKLVNENKDVI